MVDYRPSINFQAPFIVMKPFEGNGRHFKSGENFPWKKLSISPRRMRQLFASRYIKNVDEAAVEIENDDELNNPSDNEKYRIVKTVGKGYYDIIEIATGKVLNEKHLRMGDAEAFLTKIIEQEALEAAKTENASEDAEKKPEDNSQQSETQPVKTERKIEEVEL